MTKPKYVYKNCKACYFVKQEARRSEGETNYNTLEKQVEPEWECRCKQMFVDGQAAKRFNQEGGFAITKMAYSKKYIPKEQRSAKNKVDMKPNAIKHMDVIRYEEEGKGTQYISVQKESYDNDHVDNQCRDEVFDIYEDYSYGGYMQFGQMQNMALRETAIHCDMFKHRIEDGKCTDNCVICKYQYTCYFSKKRYRDLTKTEFRQRMLEAMKK